jgi:hypothetical protein
VRPVESESEEDRRYPSRLEGADLEDILHSASHVSVRLTQLSLCISIAAEFENG